MTETWNPGIPIITNQVSADILDIEENFDYLMAGHGYWVDSSEADQGQAGSGNSVKDLVDAIGSTKNAIIFFKHHAADGNTTTYTVTTAETIPSNITVVVQPGVRIDGAGTLTINSPFNPGLYQVFGSTITIEFGDGLVGPIYPQWWGATGDGTTDDITAINACIVAGETAGRATVKIVAGQYAVTSAILIGDDITLDMDPNAEILRDFSVTVPVTALTKYTGATIRQRSTSSGSPNTNIVIKGGIIKAKDAADEGPHLIMYYVEDLRIENVTVLDVKGGDWAVAVYGDRILIKGMYIDTGTYTIYYDGIHVYAGTDITISDCYIKSGDDMIGIGSTGDLSIERVTVNNITGSSGQGFAIKIFNDDAGGSNYIKDIAASNITAKTGDTRNGMIYIQDEYATYGVSNVVISDCVLSTGTTSTVNPDGITVISGDNIVFNNIIVKSPRRYGFYALNSKNIKLMNSVIGEPVYASGAYQSINLDTVDKVSVIGCTIGAANLLASNMRLDDATNIHISNNTFIDIIDGYSGITMVKSASTCDNLIISNNIFIDEAGASASYALSNESASVDRLIFTGNDIEQLIGGIIFSSNNFPGVQVIENNVGAVETVSADANYFNPAGVYYLDTSGGALTGTMPDGLNPGQTVLLSMQTAGNNYDLTITSHETNDAEVARFAAADQYLLMVWTGTEWATVANTCTFP